MNLPSYWCKGTKRGDSSNTPYETNCIRGNPTLYSEKGNLYWKCWLYICHSWIFIPVLWQVNFLRNFVTEIIFQNWNDYSCSNFSQVSTLALASFLGSIWFAGWNGFVGLSGFENLWFHRNPSNVGFSNTTGG